MIYVLLLMTCIWGHTCYQEQLNYPFVTQAECQQMADLWMNKSTDNTTRIAFCKQYPSTDPTKTKTTTDKTTTTSATNPKGTNN